jgi:hypothetical protein
MQHWRYGARDTPSPLDPLEHSPQMNLVIAELERLTLETCKRLRSCGINSTSPNGVRMLPTRLISMCAGFSCDCRGAAARSDSSMQLICHNWTCPILDFRHTAGPEYPCIVAVMQLSIREARCFVSAMHLLSDKLRRCDPTRSTNVPARTDSLDIRLWEDCSMAGLVEA